MAFYYQMKYGDPYKRYTLTGSKPDYINYLRDEWGYKFGSSKLYIDHTYDLIGLMYAMPTEVPQHCVQHFMSGNMEDYHAICMFLPQFYQSINDQYNAYISSVQGQRSAMDTLMYAIQEHRTVMSRAAKELYRFGQARPSVHSSLYSPSCAGVASGWETVPREWETMSQSTPVVYTHQTTELPADLYDMGNVPTASTAPTAPIAPPLHFNSAADVAMYENHMREQGIAIFPPVYTKPEHTEPHTEPHLDHDQDVLFEELPDEMKYVPIGVGCVQLGRRKRTIAEMYEMIDNQRVATEAVPELETIPDSTSDGGAGTGGQRTLPFLQIELEVSMTDAPTQFQLNFGGFVANYALTLHLHENNTVRKKTVHQLQELISTIAEYIQYYVYDKGMHQMTLAVVLMSALQRVPPGEMRHHVSEILRYTYESVCDPQYVKFIN